MSTSLRVSGGGGGAATRRQRQRPALLLLLLALLLLHLVTNICAHPHETVAQGMVPSKELTETSLDGDTYDLRTLTLEEGRYVVLQIMATTCRICTKVGANLLAPLHQHMLDAGQDHVQFLSVSVGHDNPMSLGSYVRTNGFAWPHALDSDNALVKYQAYRVPKLVIVDHNMMQRGYYSGLSEITDAVAQLAPLVKGIKNDVYELPPAYRADVGADTANEGELEGDDVLAAAIADAIADGEGEGEEEEEDEDPLFSRYNFGGGQKKRKAPVVSESHAASAHEDDHVDHGMLFGRETDELDGHGHDHDGDGDADGEDGGGGGGGGGGAEEEEDHIDHDSAFGVELAELGAAAMHVSSSLPVEGNTIVYADSTDALYRSAGTDADKHRVEFGMMMGEEEQEEGEEEGEGEDGSGAGGSPLPAVGPQLPAASAAAAGDVDSGGQLDDLLAMGEEDEADEGVDGVDVHFGDAFLDDHDGAHHDSAEVDPTAHADADDEHRVELGLAVDEAEHDEYMEEQEAAQAAAAAAAAEVDDGHRVELGLAVGEGEHDEHEEEQEARRVETAAEAAAQAVHDDHHQVELGLAVGEEEEEEARDERAEEHSARAEREVAQRQKEEQRARAQAAAKAKSAAATKEEVDSARGVGHHDNAVQHIRDKENVRHGVAGAKGDAAAGNGNDDRRKLFHDRAAGADSDEHNKEHNEARAREVQRERERVQAELKRQQERDARKAQTAGAHASGAAVAGAGVEGHREFDEAATKLREKIGTHEPRVKDVAPVPVYEPVLEALPVAERKVEAPGGGGNIGIQYMVNGSPLKGEAPEPSAASSQAGRRDTAAGEAALLKLQEKKKAEERRKVEAKEQEAAAQEAAKKKLEQIRQRGVDRADDSGEKLSRHDREARIHSTENRQREVVPHNREHESDDIAVKVDKDGRKSRELDRHLKNGVPQRPVRIDAKRKTRDNATSGWIEWVRAAVFGGGGGDGDESLYYFAAVAGFFSFFSPCAFSLLPGYVSFYLGTYAHSHHTLGSSALGPLVAGSVGGFGILCIYGALGLVSIPFAHLIAEYLPLLEPTVGLGLAAMGIVMVRGYVLDMDFLFHPVRRVFKFMLGIVFKGAGKSAKLPTSAEELVDLGIDGEHFATWSDEEDAEGGGGGQWQEWGGANENMAVDEQGDLLMNTTMHEPHKMTFRKGAAKAHDVTAIPSSYGGGGGGGSDGGGQAKERRRAGKQTGYAGLFWFGVAYGSASAGCSTPVYFALLMASMQTSLQHMLEIFLVYVLTNVVCLIACTYFIQLFGSFIILKLDMGTYKLRKYGGVGLALVGVYTLGAYVHRVTLGA